MAVIFNAYFGQYIVDVFSQTPRASKFELRKSWGPNGAPGDFSRLLVFFSSRQKFPSFVLNILLHVLWAVFCTQPLMRFLAVNNGWYDLRQRVTLSIGSGNQNFWWFLPLSLNASGHLTVALYFGRCASVSLSAAFHTLKVTLTGDPEKIEAKWKLLRTLVSA